MKIEFGATRTDFIKLISMVKKSRKLFILAANLSLNAKNEKRTGSQGTYGEPELMVKLYCMVGECDGIFAGLTNFIWEFSVSLERVELYRDDFSVTRTRFQIFGGYKTSIERRKERAIHTTALSRCDYDIGDDKNYYWSRSLYIEMNFAVTWQLHGIRNLVGIIAQTLRIVERSFVQVQHRFRWRSYVLRWHY